MFLLVLSLLAAQTRVDVEVVGRFGGKAPNAVCRTGRRHNTADGPLALAIGPMVYLTGDSTRSGIAGRKRRLYVRSKAPEKKC